MLTEINNILCNINKCVAYSFIYLCSASECNANLMPRSDTSQRLSFITNRKDTDGMRNINNTL